MKGKLRVNPRIRRLILISGPVIFSFFSAWIYILMWSPERHTPEHSNIILVFSAAIGWSAHILYGNREMYKAAYWFSALSVLIPIVIFEAFSLYAYDVYQGRIIIGMIIAGNLWLLLIYRNLRLKDKKAA